MKIIFQVIIQKYTIFQRTVQRVSDKSPKQWKQLSLALLYVQHAKELYVSDNTTKERFKVLITVPR
jgi:hypothetical protein